MAEDPTAEPLDLLVRSTRDLLRPEELVREATRDIVKDEIRHHIEKKLRDDPKLAEELRDAIRQLLDARAREYAAILRVATLSARLGVSTLPEDVRRMISQQVVSLVSSELGQIAEKAL
ncbi:MAG: hypothetical protein M1606_02080 [Candidatus Thermoplasmatota archaeon]|jgi:hypothetical protein|nr:hypothetical protein [Candidatus Thermoplasmatota archaeon]MCL5983438.1 hypothetical protein [Candidatus Thermoplasmatota archaeon]